MASVVQCPELAAFLEAGPASASALRLAAAQVSHRARVELLESSVMESRLRVAAYEDIISGQRETLEALYARLAEADAAAGGAAGGSGAGAAGVPASSGVLAARQPGSSASQYNTTVRSVSAGSLQASTAAAAGLARQRGLGSTVGALPFFPPSSPSSPAHGDKGSIGGGRGGAPFQAGQRSVSAGAISDTARLLQQHSHSLSPSSPTSPVSHLSGGQLGAGRGLQSERSGGGFELQESATGGGSTGDGPTAPSLSNSSLHSSLAGGPEAGVKALGAVVQSDYFQPPAPLRRGSSGAHLLMRDSSSATLLVRDSSSATLLAQPFPPVLTAATVVVAEPALQPVFASPSQQAQAQLLSAAPSTAAEPALASRASPATVPAGTAWLSAAAGAHPMPRFSGGPSPAGSSSSSSSSSSPVRFLGPPQPSTGGASGRIGGRASPAHYHPGPGSLSPSLSGDAIARAIAPLIPCNAAPSEVDLHIDALIIAMQPSEEAERVRHRVCTFVKQLLKRALGAQVFAVGPYPTKTYLDDDPVGLSAFLCLGQERTWSSKVAEALFAASEAALEGSVFGSDDEGGGADGDTARTRRDSAYSGGGGGGGGDGMMSDDGDRLPQGGVGGGGDGRRGGSFMGEGLWTAGALDGGRPLSRVSMIARAAGGLPVGAGAASEAASTAAIDYASFAASAAMSAVSTHAAGNGGGSGGSPQSPTPGHRGSSILRLAAPGGLGGVGGGTIEEGSEHDDAIAAAVDASVSAIAMPTGGGYGRGGDDGGGSEPNHRSRSRSGSGASLLSPHFAPPLGGPQLLVAEADLLVAESAVAAGGEIRPPPLADGGEEGLPSQGGSSGVGLVARGSISAGGGSGEAGGASSSPKRRTSSMVTWGHNVTVLGGGGGASGSGGGEPTLQDEGGAGSGDDGEAAGAEPAAPGAPSSSTSAASAAGGGPSSRSFIRASSMVSICSRGSLRTDGGTPVCRVQAVSFVAGGRSDKRIVAEVDGVTVSVSANQLHELCQRAIVEHADAAIGKNHLLKRSLLLFRAWALHDSNTFATFDLLSRTLPLTQGAALRQYLVDHNSAAPALAGLSWRACVTLILWTFVRRGASISQPFQALCWLLADLAAFDFDNYALCIGGAVPLSQLATASAAQHLQVHIDQLSASRGGSGNGAARGPRRRERRRGGKGDDGSGDSPSPPDGPSAGPGPAAAAPSGAPASSRNGQGAPAGSRFVFNPLPPPENIPPPGAYGYGPHQRAPNTVVYQVVPETALRTYRRKCARRQAAVQAAATKVGGARAPGTGGGRGSSGSNTPAHGAPEDPDVIPVPAVHSGLASALAPVPVRVRSVAILDVLDPLFNLCQGMGTREGARFKQTALAAARALFQALLHAQPNPPHTPAPMPMPMPAAGAAGDGAERAPAAPSPAPSASSGSAPPASDYATERSGGTPTSHTAYPGGQQSHPAPPLPAAATMVTVLGGGSTTTTYVTAQPHNHGTGGGSSGVGGGGGSGASLALGGTGPATAAAAASLAQLDAFFTGCWARYTSTVNANGGLQDGRFVAIARARSLAAAGAAACASGGSLALEGGSLQRDRRGSSSASRDGRSFAYSILDASGRAGGGGGGHGGGSGSFSSADSSSSDAHGAGARGGAPAAELMAPVPSGGGEATSSLQQPSHEVPAHHAPGPSGSSGSCLDVSTTGIFDIFASDQSTLTHAIDFCSFLLDAEVSACEGSRRTFCNGPSC